MCWAHQKEWAAAVHLPAVICRCAFTWGCFCRGQRGWLCLVRGSWAGAALQVADVPRECCAMLLPGHGLVPKGGRSIVVPADTRLTVGRRGRGLPFCGVGGMPVSQAQIRAGTVLPDFGQRVSSGHPRRCSACSPGPDHPMGSGCLWESSHGVIRGHLQLFIGGSAELLARWTWARLNYQGDEAIGSWDRALLGYPTPLQQLHPRLGCAKWDRSLLSWAGVTAEL